MPKNVSIMEGGKAYNFTVEKIKTGLSSAGEATWIPEDSCKTGVLACNKKWATYKASGVVGWHRVYINDSGSGSGPDEYPSLGEHDVSIQESGIQEDYSGVDRVDLAGVSGRERFVYDGGVVSGTLVRTVDGDTAAAVYDASSDGVQAYTEVTVRGLADKIVVQRNPTKMAYEAGETFNPAGMVVYPAYKDGSKWQCPEHTGDILGELTYSPSVIPDNVWDCDITITWPRYDDSKALTSVITVSVEAEMPDHIVVTTPPTKTVYNNGDTINFSGIMVKAYKANGDPWEVPGYSGGVISFSELTFPVSIAKRED